MRKYLELNSKVHIDSPVFRVTGRVVESSGGNLILKMCSGSGDVQIAIEMSRKANPTFVKGEIVTIAGYNDESTCDKIRLRCGELIERGIRLK